MNFLLLLDDVFAVVVFVGMVVTVTRLLVIVACVMPVAMAVIVIWEEIISLIA